MNNFSLNGEIKPIEAAQHSVLSAEFSYGFGVYENIRVKHNKPLFINEHIYRLLQSAKGIGLKHGFSFKQITKFVDNLIDKLNGDTYNLKILLIGSQQSEQTLYILPMKPSFPDRKLYKNGVHTITYEYERFLPNVKSLNMLPSYLAFQKARQVDAYDALFINRSGDIVEGGRTNFFATRRQTLFTAPDKEILLGVTRTHVLEIAKTHGWTVEFLAPKLKDIDSYDSCFLTSTSSKIMPIRSIDKHTFTIPGKLKQLQKDFNSYLASID